MIQKFPNTIAISELKINTYRWHDCQNPIHKKKRSIPMAMAESHLRQNCPIFAALQRSTCCSLYLDIDLPFELLAYTPIQQITRTKKTNKTAPNKGEKKRLHCVVHDLSGNTRLLFRWMTRDNYCIQLQTLLTNLNHQLKYFKLFNLVSNAPRSHSSSFKRRNKLILRMGYSVGLL